MKLEVPSLLLFLSLLLLQSHRSLKVTVHLAVEFLESILRILVTLKISICIVILVVETSVAKAILIIHVSFMIKLHMIDV